MVADGLDGAVLPPFSASEIDGVNVYPDPPDIQRTFVEGSIVGTRVESTTMVPIVSGAIEIPQISVPWWNINTDQLEATVVPATRIVIATIEGDVPAEQTVASSANIEELLAATPVVDQDMIDEQNAAEFIEVDASWLNYLIAAAFIIVALSIYQLVIVNHKREISAFIKARRAEIAANYSPQNNERVAFRQLRKACRGNDLNTLREKLIVWCDHFLDDRAVLSMEDILQQWQADKLRPYVQQIQSALFNEVGGRSQNSSFRPLELLKLVSDLRHDKLRASKQRYRQERYALPPLYRT